VNGGALPPAHHQQVEPAQPPSVEGANDNDDIEEILAVLDHDPAAEKKQGDQDADAFESALNSVLPAPPLRRGRQGAGGLTRRELKTELALAWFTHLRALHTEGVLVDRARWWAPRDFLKNSPRLGALYRAANAIGDALGRGHGKEGGLALARDSQGRVAATRENAIRCIRHFRTVGWTDERVAELFGSDPAEFKTWILDLPRDDEFFPPAGPSEGVGHEQP
jgi:hypothetical protein